MKRALVVVLVGAAARAGRCGVLEGTAVELTFAQGPARLQPSAVQALAEGWRTT